MLVPHDWRAEGTALLLSNDCLLCAVDWDPSLPGYDLLVSFVWLASAFFLDCSAVAFVMLLVSGNGCSAAAFVMRLIFCNGLNRTCASVFCTSLVSVSFWMSGVCD